MRLLRSRKTRSGRRWVPPQIGFMTAVVGASLLLMPAFGLLAQHLYDEEELLRLRAEAYDAQIRADMAERGWICPTDGAAAAHADALRVTMGVELLSPVEPFDVPTSTGSLTGRPPETNLTENAASLVRRELSRYPRSFLRSTRLRRVLLCSELREGGRTIPSLPNYLSTLLLDVDAPPDYLRRLVHHELYHFADFAEDHQVKRDREWAALNETFFVYGDGGRFMRDPKSGDLRDDLPGFLTRYATSAVEEDKAEVFAFLVTEPERVQRIAQSDPVIASKVAMVKQRVARLSPEMNDEFWRRVAD